MAKQKSRFWLWGLHPVKAALENLHRPCFQLWTTAEQHTHFATLCTGRPDSPAHHTVSRDALNKQWPNAVHQGSVLEVGPLPSWEETVFFQSRPSSLPKANQQSIFLALDGVTDPHNVGAIFRTAKALDAQGLILTKAHAPPLTGVLAKSASGALDTLPFLYVTNLARCLQKAQSQGFWCIGLSEQGDKMLYDISLPDLPLILVLGSEGKGIRPLIQSTCDFLARLPSQPEFPSFNVSVATALALHTLRFFRP